MGYFDKLAEDAFKVIDDTTLVYYPNGIFGKGRVVPDEKAKEILFKFQKNIYKVTYFVIFPYAWLLGMSRSLSIGTISPIILFIIIYMARQHSLVKGFAIHDSKLGFKESVLRGSKSLPNWYCWTLGVVSVAMIALSVLSPLLSNKPYASFLLLILGTSSMGLLGLALSIKMYKLKGGRRG